MQSFGYSLLGKYSDILLVLFIFVFSWFLSLFCLHCFTRKVSPKIMYAYMSICMYVSTYVRMRVYMYVCMHVCSPCMYVRMCVCMYKCTSIYIYFLFKFATVWYMLIFFFYESWKNNKALPDGLIYDGVSSEPLQVGICPRCKRTFDIVTRFINDTLSKLEGLQC